MRIVEKVNRRHAFAPPPACKTRAHSLYKSTSFPAKRMTPNSVFETSKVLQGELVGSYVGVCKPVKTGGRGELRCTMMLAKPRRKDLLRW